jgi:hypothetical protein
MPVKPTVLCLLRARAAATLAPFFDESFSPQAFISQALTQSSSVLERLEGALTKVEQVLRAKVCVLSRRAACVSQRARAFVSLRVRECLPWAHSIAFCVPSTHRQVIAHHPELVRRASHVDEVEQQLRAVALRIRGLHAAVTKYGSRS